MTARFVRNGTCEQACAHGIYVNRLALMRVERSTYPRNPPGSTRQIPRLKTEVFRLHIGDGQTGTASYLVDIPNGGAVIIQNNRLEKGPQDREPFGCDLDRGRRRGQANT